MPRVQATLYNHKDFNESTGGPAWDEDEPYAHQIDFLTEDILPEKMQDLSGEPRIYKKASSLKYDCPPGIALVFGENTTICPNSWLLSYTGSGEVANLRDGNANDRFRCWMWKSV